MSEKYEFYQVSIRLHETYNKKLDELYVNYMTKTRKVMPRSKFCHMIFRQMVDEMLKSYPTVETETTEQADAKKPTR
jgi:hypothetical protein